MPTFKLYLFGSPHLEQDRAVVKISRRKVLALLAYLAATGKTHARDSLTTLFWPDYSQSEARVALSRHLSELNKVLPSGMLVLEAESVVLGGDLWLDVATFEATLVAGSNVIDHNLSSLQAAVNLYTADFLAGFTLPDCPDFDNWQTFQAESLRQSLRTALEKIALAQAAAQDFENAIITTRRWLSLDLLDEAAQRALMQIYAQSGQQSAALRQYEQCLQILADELSVAPMEETTHLYERIRRGELRQGDKGTGGQGDGENSLTADPSATPVGPFVASPSQPAPRHNLPAQTTPFIGREVELAEVARLLTSQDVRLLTIVGNGGMGKTRLAWQSGRRLLQHFPDGVWFLSLAAVDGDDSGRVFNPLLSGLADVLGLTLHSGSTPEAQILTHLHDRRLLLILDNLEHLLESSAVISDLLRGATGITVLTTSRERLNLQEEWLFPLQGLALPATETGEVAQPEITEAVELFAQVAQRVQPAFDPLHNWRAIAQICRLVEGMPLGIELAASWVRYMTLEAIAQEIEDSIDFLTTTIRNVPARHRSMRAVFDHSWRLLSPQEQAVLPVLAVFRGGFRYTEAQSVAAAARFSLITLVDKSLLWVTADSRYDLHELLRQYLLEKLRQNLSLYQAVHERHSQVYLALMELDRVELARPTTLQRISGEYDNVRAAWQWALDHALWWAIRRAQQGMRWFHIYAGRLLEVTELYEQAISDLEPHTKLSLSGSSAFPGSSLTEVHLLLASMRCAHSELQMRIGIHDPQRMSLLAENLAILRALGPDAHRELAEALLGAIAPERRRIIGSYEPMWRYAQEALILCQVLDYAHGQCRALISLGIAAYLAGQFEQAETYAQQLLALAEHVGDAYQTASALSILGDLALARGDYAQAECHYETGHQQIFSKIPTFAGVVFWYADLANIARLRGNYSQAQTYIQQGELVVKRVGHGHTADFRHHVLMLAKGHLAETQGDLVAAQQAFQIIWQQDQEHSHYSSAALIGLGWIALRLEDWPTARRHLTAALSLSVQLKTALQALECLAGMAHVEAQIGHREDALAMVTLVLHHTSTPRQTKDRLTELHAMLVAKLPSAAVEAMRSKGVTSQLWTIAAELLVRLT